MNDIVVKLILSMKTLNDLQTSMFGSLGIILGDPGAVSRVDKMFVVKVYCILTVNFHHEHFIDPTNCPWPWVSEDDSVCLIIGN